MFFPFLSTRWNFHSPRFLQRLFILFLIFFFFFSILSVFFVWLDWRRTRWISSVKSIFDIQWYSGCIALVIGEMKFYNFVEAFLFIFFYLIVSPSIIIVFFFFWFNSLGIKRALFLRNFKKNAIIAGMGIRQQGIFYLNVWILNTRYELQITKENICWISNCVLRGIGSNVRIHSHFYYFPYYIFFPGLNTCGGWKIN